MRLRAPQVNAFFPEDLNAELEDRLLEYAQEKLGCRSLSPLWMSYYVDGCHQGLHADNPHGAVTDAGSLRTRLTQVPRDWAMQPRRR